MFYKYEDEQLFSSNMVTFPDGPILIIEDLPLLELPHEGWYYFSTEQEAKEFFGITE